MPCAAMILWNNLNIIHGKLQLAPAILLALFGFSLIRVKMALRPAGSPPHPPSALLSG